MNCTILRLGSLTLLLIVASSCGQKSRQNVADVNSSDTYADEKKELPINVVIKRDSTPSQPHIPGDAPLAVGADLAAPGAPGPFPLPPFAPPLIPVPLTPPDDDNCDIPFCGNGIKEDGEDCDDGDDDNADVCDNFCRKPDCGNGVIEGEEECDSPDNINCTDNCTLKLCGNGEIDDGETCDPPNNSTCNANCRTSVCGNNIVELGEECDAAVEGCVSCELSCIPMTTTPRKSAKP
jgi:hypothetical protein